MPRKRTGTLLPPGADGILRARVTETTKLPDGSTVTDRPIYKLGTTDRQLAKARLAKLVRELAAGRPVPLAVEAVNAAEQLREYAERWLARREAQGVGMAKKERRNLELHALGAIGNLPLCDVRPPHIRAILDVAAGRGMLRNSLAHIRGVLHRLFRAAVEEELIETNPVSAVRPPRTREIRKERVILSDSEFTKLLLCERVDLELRMLALSARCEGGMRTGDLNNWDWTMLELDGFSECFIPRSKTGKPQRLAIPEKFAPFLRAWWEQAGQPKSGPVFPVTRGKRAGERRSPNGLSFAKRLRRALFRAGVWRQTPVEVLATSPGTRTDLGRQAKGTKLAPNPRDPLYFETETTLPVDFHSFRRAFATALAELDVSPMRAMHLASHTDPRTHGRYVMQTTRMRTIPDEALPPLPADALAKARKGAGNVTPRDDSSGWRSVPPELLRLFGAGGGSRTPDLARMKRPL